MSEKKRGVMLVNLGSPESTEVKDVYRYLMEFLMDGRVIDYPHLFRKLLVGGIIVPLRAAKSAEAYRAIWTKEGSPLVQISGQLRESLQTEMDEPVVLAMRYGKPSVEAAFEKLVEAIPGLEEVVSVPLYPHYAMSSYETAVEHAREVHRRKGYRFRLRFVPAFYGDQRYLEALSENIRPYLENDYDHLLFSYHGIPQRHIKKSDVTGTHCLQRENCCLLPSSAHAFCYRHQVLDTTSRVVEILRIPQNKYSVSFQSRLGKGWLEPFTDLRLEAFPQEGVKKLLVVCPSFVSDCLETLEEIAIRGKESFLLAGGESFQMIPCLNVHPLWIKAVAGLVRDFSTQTGGQETVQAFIG